MKNKAPSGSVALSEELRDLIELSEIRGGFRDFVEQHLFPHHSGFPTHDFSEETLLHALNEAKLVDRSDETERLTLQVIKFIDKVGLPLDHYKVYPTIGKVGEFYWPDRTLEFFAFLVSQGNYPIQRWRSILKNREHLYRRLLLDDVEISTKPLEDQISEGILRHTDESPHGNSPFSLFFWFNIELWKAEPRMPGMGAIKTKNKETGEWERDEGEDPSLAPWESAQYPHSKKIFNAVLRQWATAMLEADNEDAIYAFFNWADDNRILDRGENDQLKKAVVDSIWEDVQSRPIPEPVYPLALKDMPTCIRALYRKLWSRGSEAFTSSEAILRNLQDQLVQIAKLCAEDQLKAKLPLGIIRDLIPVFYWVPEGYIPNRSYPQPAQESLAIKLFALMRSCLQHDLQAFHIYDYRDAMQLLVSKGKEAALLRQLLMAFRSCPKPCSSGSLDFRPKRKINGYILPVQFSGLPPEYCLSCLIDLLIGSHQLEDRYRNLCMDTAEYFMSRLKFRKQKGRARAQEKLSGFYDEKKCVESDPIWRRAYAEALGEFGYAIDGKVLHLLDFVRKHDPDEAVREAAQSSYRVIHREQTKDLDDYKSLRAAFWVLRKAQREALNLPIELALAKLLRRQELRNERQTNASLIYIGYLDMH